MFGVSERPTGCAAGGGGGGGGGRPPPVLEPDRRPSPGAPAAPARCLPPAHSGAPHGGGPHSRPRRVRGQQLEATWRSQETRPDPGNLRLNNIPAIGVARGVSRLATNEHLAEI